MEIYGVRFCMGMIPLAKKLFNDVHAHRRTLAEMAASVTDWETVEPQCSFDSNFAADFANRRTFGF